MATDKRSLKHWLEFYAFQVFLLIAHFVPLACCNWLGSRLGSLAFTVLKKRRLLTLENLREAQQRGFLADGINVEQVARRTWEHLGMLGSEFVFYANRPHGVLKNVTIEGEANLRRILEKQRGVIMAVGHIGNWELMGARIALAGVGVSSIAKAQSNTLLDDYIIKTRQAAGINSIPKLSFLRPVLRAFEHNQLVSFFIDQNAGSAGLPIKLFGRETRIARGAAEFALKTDTPVVFGYIVRETQGRQRIVISEEITLSRSGDKAVDLMTNTTTFIGLIQAVIQKHPDQWLWMHKLWDTDIKL
jgi:KDO2-lipid IV(A) lauroyltransferase